MIVSLSLKRVVGAKRKYQNHASPSRILDLTLITFLEQSPETIRQDPISPGADLALTLAG